MRRYGLIGYPLSHSFSKKFFDEKFEKEKLADCRFENFSISSIKELEHILQTNTDLNGLAVTIPHKQSVLDYLSSTEGIPEGLTVCNCIKIENGELIGYNTDIVGFEKSLSPLLKPHHTSALIFGNGGATAAVLYVLKKIGIAYQVVSRKLHSNSSFTYEQLTPEFIHKTPVLINTTPLGMYPNTDTCPDLPYEGITENHLLYDLVYNPATTLFLQKGKERGAAIKNGADMLEIQAEENWRIWNS
jgi:shikimate dehydrogenase